MAWSRPTRWPTDLPSPEDDPGLARTYAGFKKVLATMSQAQLMEEARLNAIALQQQADDRLARLLASTGSSSSIDQLVPRTTPQRSTPEPLPRGRAAQASPSQPPDPFQHLSSRGRRLALKLVAANARSVAHRRIR